VGGAPAPHFDGSFGKLVFIFDVVFCTSLDGRRPANLQTALVAWYASASASE
jgi:hypothetical protein